MKGKSIKDTGVRLVYRQAEFRKDIDISKIP